MKSSLYGVYPMIKKAFKVRVKSKLAIMFTYKIYEITLFNGGRMLIKNVKSEKAALSVYREIRKKLNIVR
jgi:ArsR family metal-binding transcriptional regulator